MRLLCSLSLLCCVFGASLSAQEDHNNALTVATPAKSDAEIWLEHLNNAPDLFRPPLTAAVSYHIPKGRLGDKLLGVAHAAWFAHVLKLPLVYKAYPYFDQLQIDDDTSLLRELPAVGHKLTLQTPADYLQFYEVVSRGDSFEDTLIEVPFYPESPYLFVNHTYQPQFTQIDWYDVEFLATLRKWFAPKIPVVKLDLPADRVTVALHYRTGENYDRKKWQNAFPLKGPPDSYYIDCLNYLIGIEKRPLYVYIFTDSLEPQRVAAKFQQLFPAIEFACRTDVPAEEAVLEDFFRLEGFECLIRPDSHFSVIAGHLFNYRIMMSPSRFQVRKEEFVIDQIQIEVKTPSGTRFTTRLRGYGQ